jgi:hypothetical protein
MPKALTCPNCGAPLEFSDDAIGQTKCEYCGTPIMLTGEFRRVRPDEVKQAPPPPPPPIIIQQTRIESDRVTVDLNELMSHIPASSRPSGCVGCFTGLFFTVVSFAILSAIMVGSGALTPAMINGVLTQLPPGAATAASGAINTVFPDLNLGSPATTVPPRVSIGVPTATPNASGSGSSTEPIQGRVIGDTPQDSLLLGGTGTGLGKFSDARHIAVSTDGKIYVTDFNTKRVQRFLPDGTFDVMFEIQHGQNDYGPWAIAADRNYFYAVVEGDLIQYSAETGKMIRQFAHSADFDDVTVAANGNVIALANDVTRGGDRIIIFNNEGRKLNEFEDNVAGVIDETTIFDHLIAADGLGNVYVFVGFEYFVFKFSPQGRYVDRFGGEGSGPDQFRSPSSIGVDSQGRVYVSDLNVIKVFDSNGNFIRTIQPENGAYRDFAFDLNDNLYIVINDEVHRVSAS